MKPALTPEEWAHVQEIQEGRTVSAAIDITGAYYGRHGATAMCLDGQPFGFTQGDVDSARIAARALRAIAGPVGPMHSFWDTIFCLEGAADRIEALIRPST